MANSSLSTNLASISHPLDEGEEVVIEQPILRPRPPIWNAPKPEKLDSKYEEFILTLPKDEQWAGATLHKLRGFWLSDRILHGVLTMEEVFRPRPTDVIVASLLKSGTTWLKALTFTIMHRNKYDFSCHPLLKLNPHDCVPFIERYYALRDEQYLETLPSPRVLGTHLAYSLLPESIKESKCPIVYICREPKDVLVSPWHMIRGFELLDQSFPFNKAFESFCEGRTPNGPIWDHVREYYTESLLKPNKILLLKYEQMLQDPVDGVMKIASFIGCPFSEEEVKNGLLEDIVEFCSFNKLKGIDINRNGSGKVKK